MTTTTRHSLNELTTTITAFSSWEKFAAAMATGYVPTLRKITGRSAKTREYNAMVDELVVRLEALGYTVWTG